MIREIGLSEYINCVLVQENVRSAMMLQSIDYGEHTLGPITQSKLKSISTNFPDLIQSPLQLGNVLISKTKYYAKDIEEKKLGEILGYPCPGLNDLEYRVSIDAEFEDKSVQIFGMRCDEKNHNLNKFAEKVLSVLKMDPHLDIKNVNVVIKKDINPEYIIDKLISYNLTDREIDEIGNYLYNTGFSDLIMYDFEYDNPVHVGILCTLISYYINDPIMAFAPLQKFPNEYKKSDEIVKKLEANIINTLRKTKKIA
jgi:hypothetical protein